MGANYLEHFVNPPAMFRGAPFWAWNCKLDEETLMKQIEYFKEMGIGGFTMHSRTGLDIPYLGSEFMRLVRACVDKAKEMDMKAYLYDEDRWPSGFAGGEVTKDPAFRSRYLAFLPESAEREPADRIRSGRITGGEGGKLIARYDIKLKNGCLESYRMLDDGETGENIYCAYLEISTESPWFNNQTYVDTLNKKAMQRFIEITHEAYFKAVGDEFGGVVPSIFTDEPQFMHKTVFGRADDKACVIIPYTDDFEESFTCTYGQSFLKHLPEVFWELPNGEVSVARYRYHDHVAERFARAFSDTVGDWCKAHGLKLTGHMMEEPTLHSQTAALGEVMRHFRSFGIPGIDMLCDRREYTTAKQAQSAAHQLGSNEVASELYGVTNWDFDFRGHKLQGDWQAALGITHRVHHLSWVSMKGEAKRDYPASIFYQSPWYKKYNDIETYFARVNTALRSGEPMVKIGVIHPVESYWLYYGPEEQTADIRAKLELQFSRVTEWLLFGLLDFDFISESLMESLDTTNHNSSGLAAGGKDKSFKVGEMEYSVIVVPGCVTLRSSTVRRLSEFMKAGGDVIFMGGIPKYVDAVPSELTGELKSKGTEISFDRIELMNTLSGYRSVDMHDQKGIRSDRYITQFRRDGDNKILFIANGREAENQDIPRCAAYTINVGGLYEPEIMDAMTGKRLYCPAAYMDGNTVISYSFYEHDSLLLYLTKISEEKSVPGVFSDTCGCFAGCLNNVDLFETNEPNVLLLDKAEYSLDGEVYRPAEEVLRIDNILRTELNYPRKLEAFAQPWTRTDDDLVSHELKLRYSIQSDIECNAQLAIEFCEDMEIMLNGEAICTEPTGYFVDECIKKLRIPFIKAGVNELVVRMRYSQSSNLEWCYLLGDFGVYVYGDKTKIIPCPSEIGFSDLTTQGFPFFAGNMTYICEADVPDGEYELEINKYRAALLSVSVDGSEKGSVMFSPYRISLGRLCGKHRIEITAYGNRANAFGPVHNCNEKEKWFGPTAWRAEGAAFSYEYMLKRFGILSAPRLYKK